MILEDYKQLIQNLPVRQQSFTIKRHNKKWIKAEDDFKWFKDLNDIFFIDEQLQISRQDIFDITNSPKEKILKTIFWGYPNGMPGGLENFKGILSKINNLVEILSDLQNRKNLKREDLEKAQGEFKQISGLGLSTYSKLLYFFDIQITNLPCLIFDRRLQKIFQLNTFEELNLNYNDINNKENKYLDYLIIINKVAEKLETKGENIEQFLFIFGKNLNSSSAPSSPKIRV